MNIPELKGTQKQIKWATGIRGQVIEKIQEIIRIISNPKFKSALPLPAAAQILTEGLQALLEKRVDAEYWIDNRYNKTSAWKEECEFAISARRKEEICAAHKPEKTVSTNRAIEASEGETGVSPLTIRQINRREFIQKLAASTRQRIDALELMEAADSSGLPELHGSDKQINWAHKLRSDCVYWWLGACEEYPDLLEEFSDEQLRRVFEQLIWNTSASWWINNRERLAGKDFVNLSN